MSKLISIINSHVYHNFVQIIVLLNETVSKEKVIVAQVLPVTNRYLLFFWDVNGSCQQETLPFVVKTPIGGWWIAVIAKRSQWDHSCFVNAVYVQTEHPAVEKCHHMHEIYETEFPKLGTVTAYVQESSLTLLLQHLQIILEMTTIQL